MDNENSDFIGIGWSWPPSFSGSSGNVRMTTGKEDIEKSLDILLTTTLGERMMHPEYGCNTEQMLFEPMTTTFKSEMKRMIYDAILFHEPRIVLNEVDFETRDNEGVIDVSLTYTIAGTNNRINVVYPFYLEEGTNL